MIAKKLMPVLLLSGISVFSLNACKHKPDDAGIRAAVESAVVNYSGISVDVKDGVVTLSGNVNTPDDKANIETAVNGLKDKGIKSLTDNITVAPPPPPPAMTLSPDDSLSNGVKDATKDFPSVSATVSNGIITVTGEVEKSRVQILKQSLDALHPKKTDMSALKVK